MFVSPLRHATFQPKTAEAEKAALQQKVSEQETIILEKVASGKVSPEVIDSVVNAMVASGLIAEKESKYAKTKLAEHPDNLGKLAASLAKISVPAPSQGKGIAKNASTPDNTLDPVRDAWMTVVHEGA